MAAGIELDLDLVPQLLAWNSPRMPFGSKRKAVATAYDASVESFAAAVPRLRQTIGKHVSPACIETLVQDRWSSDEAALVANTWPTLHPIPLAGLFDIACGLRRKGGGDAAQIAAWTHALFEEGPVPGNLAMRELVKREAQGLPNQPGSGPTTRVVELYRDVAGSYELGLAALAAGLSSDLTRQLAQQGELNHSDLKALAVARGIDLQ